MHHLQLGTRVPDYLAIIPPDGINYTHYDKLGHYALLVVGKSSNIDLSYMHI